MTDENLDTYSKSVTDVIYPEDGLSAGKNVVLGFQHVFAMFGSTVLGPILMGFDPNTAILFSGIATIIFYFAVGGRVPSYLGSSFSFIAAVGAATGYAGKGANEAIPVALGGIVAAGAVYTLIGLLVTVVGTRFLERIFPPIVTGAIVGIIGLNLAKVGVGQIGDNPVSILVALLTILAVALIAVFGKGFSKRISILLGALFGYFIYWLFSLAGSVTPIDFSVALNSSVIGLPKFYAPVFNATAISLIAPVAIILVAENLGHIKAIGGMIKRDLDPYMGRSFIGDGVATMISGFFGGTGVTTYAENMGVMRISRNFSSMTMIFAAVIAIALGLSPMFGEFVRTIPSPVLGGLSFVVFGLITATAGAIWQQGREAGKVDFDDNRSVLVVGLALVMGAGDFTIKAGGFALGGIVTATLAAVLLNWLLSLGSVREDEETVLNPYKS